MAKQPRKDITEVVEQYLCHSCGSCFTSCGHDSISYKKTVAGYLFPEINYDTCTNCGLCHDVCPGDHFNESLINKTSNDPFVGDAIQTYIGKSTNKFPKWWCSYGYFNLFVRFKKNIGCNCYNDEWRVLT